MPVGRFRTDPRTLDDIERKIYALQYPEGALVIGMGLGLIIPLIFQQVPNLGPFSDILGSTIMTVLAPIILGVVFYLAGHQFKKYRLQNSRK